MYCRSPAEELAGLRGWSLSLAKFESCLINTDLPSLPSKPRQGRLHAGLRERLFQLEVLGGLPDLGQDVPGGDQGGRAGGRRVPAGGRWRWARLAPPWVHP